MNSHTPHQIATAFLGMDAARLKLVDVSPLPDRDMASLRHWIAPNMCYANAFRAAGALRLDVVLGAVIISGAGLPIEHAWIAEPGKDGAHYDPTLQGLQLGHPEDTYLELYRVPIEQYPARMRELETECAIDIMTLRSRPSTAGMFVDPFKALRSLNYRRKEH